MLAIGTDIVKIERIQKLLKDNGDKFLNKIFNKKEIQYCNSYTKPHVNLSGKYAAKEAVKKALIGAKLINRISMKDIQVLNNPDKSPYVIINNINDVKCIISISHDGDYATAVAIIE